MIYDVSIAFVPLTSTAATELSTLSLHDALPIFAGVEVEQERHAGLGRIRQALRINGRVEEHLAHRVELVVRPELVVSQDRKSTRLKSSHGYISYAVFCVEKEYRNGLHRM